MKSALITVTFTTWRFERIVKVFRVYIANICWLPLCCYGYSLNLPICRSRSVRIPQGFFSSWTVVQFKKKDFPPKLIFFFLFQVEDMQEIHIFRSSWFCSGSGRPLSCLEKNIGSAGGRTQDLSRVRRTW